MSVKKRGHKRQTGFTLIELLVVVLIIGILASIAIPQYFKVVERSRLSEAQTMASQIRQAEERYLVRQGSYATDIAGLSNLDIQFAGVSPTFGMKNFTLSMSNCTASSGDTEYILNFNRCQNGTTSAGACQASSANVSSRYTAYTLQYNRCSDVYTFPSCASGCAGFASCCDSDFAQ